MKSNLVFDTVLLSSSDMHATFAAFVDQEFPQWAGEESLSQLPVILGQTDDPVRTGLITRSSTDILGVRDDQ